MSTPQEKLDIAETFTSTERETLRIWFDLDQAGHDADADRFLHAGLLLEHYQSRLDDVVANRTAADLAELARLEQDFQNEVTLAQGILAADKKLGSATAQITVAQWEIVRAFFGIKE